MTSSEQELQELRERLAADPRAREQLIAGLGDALAASPPPVDATSGPIGDLMSQANATDGPKRAAILEQLVATGMLLWAPPTLARILLGQTSSSISCVLVLCP
jgi:hypothetical protein